jgi:catechol 2,3-dioxygenase-like lactoylglutathione lyase family enzyme
MKITGQVLWVHDATLSVKFYKKLGFEVVEATDRHAIIKAGEGSFTLTLVTMRDDHEFSHDAVSSGRGIGSYLYVKCEDVDKKYQELLSLNLSTSSEPRDWEWGNREFVIKDLDEYKICFWQKLD